MSLTTDSSVAVPVSETVASRPGPMPKRARFDVLAGISGAHLLNDTMQSVILALYPLLKG